MRAVASTFAISPKAGGPIYKQPDWPIVRLPDLVVHSRYPARLPELPASLKDSVRCKPHTLIDGNHKLTNIDLILSWVIHSSWGLGSSW